MYCFKTNHQTAMLFVHDSVGEKLGLSSAMWFFCSSCLMQFQFLVAQLELNDLRWPHSHVWQLVLAGPLVSS